MTVRRPFRARSSRLVVLAALAVLAGLLPGTASADPQRGLLVVEGQGNRSATFEVPASTGFSMPMPDLTGGDRYAGVVLERLYPTRSMLVSASLFVRAFRDETGTAQAFQGSGALEAGTYRVTLLGDGPVRAEWQLDNPDRPGIAVAPRTPVAARFLGRAEPLPPDLGSARVDMPRALPVGKRVLQALLLTGTRADSAVACATTEEDCPRQVLPACPPAPLSCSPVDAAVPTWVGTGEPAATLSYSAASTEVRALRWSVEGHREEPDRLRAAAIIF